MIELFRYHTHPETLYGWSTPREVHDDRRARVRRRGASEVWVIGLDTAHNLNRPALIDEWGEHWMAYGCLVAVYRARHGFLQFRDLRKIALEREIGQTGEQLHDALNRLRKTAAAHYPGVQHVYGEEYDNKDAEERIKREMGIDQEASK
jgi:hypothetical protein